VTSFLVEDGKLVGARVRDETDGRVREVRAAVVVNATGPWAEETIALGDSPAPKHVLPSKGIHLLFRAERLPLRGAVALKSSSGREGFAIRRWSYVYVGTSDVAHDGPLDGPIADRAAMEDVLRMAQDCFPELGLTEADVVSTWAGLRPLIAEEGKSPRDTSRHDEVWRSPEGLLSIVGGKLTTYRRMGERVMEHVGRELGRDLGDSRRSAEVPLPGADLGGRDFDAWREATSATLVGRGVSAESAERIAWLYGAAADELLCLGDEDPAWLEPLAPGSAAVRGEVRLAVEQGMALSLADVLDRRTGLLLFSDDHGLAAAPEAAAITGELLGWTAAETAAQLDAYRRVAAEHGVPGLAAAAPAPTSR
jgi:glycerol-3-phosphate dehydrogenase